LSDRKRQNYVEPGIRRAAATQNYFFRFLTRRATIPRERIPRPSNSPVEPESGTVTVEATMTVMRVDIRIRREGAWKRRSEIGDSTEDAKVSGKTEVVFNT